MILMPSISAWAAVYLLEIGITVTTLLLVVSIVSIVGGAGIGRWTSTRWSLALLLLLGVLYSELGVLLMFVVSPLSHLLWRISVATAEAISTLGRFVVAVIVDTVLAAIRNAVATPL